MYPLITLRIFKLSPESVRSGFEESQERHFFRKKNSLGMQGLLRNETIQSIVQGGRRAFFPPKRFGPRSTHPILTARLLRPTEKRRTEPAGRPGRAGTDPMVSGARRDGRNLRF